VNPFRTEFQSEFQLKETDGKRIHQEFLKNWEKKIVRHMFSHKKNTNSNEFLRILLTNQIALMEKFAAFI